MALNEEYLQGGQRILFDYFVFNKQEFTNLMGVLQTQKQIIENVIQDYYCVRKGVKVEDCTDFYLTALQWAESGVSNDPPPLGDLIQPTMSLIFNNFTAFGFPEINYFVKNNSEFREKFPDLADTTFSAGHARELLAYAEDYAGGKQLKEEHRFLHLGNINFFFRMVEKNSPEAVEEIRKRFKFDTTKQARAFIEYAKYFIKGIAKQGDLTPNPDSSYSALGIPGTQALI